MKKLILFASIMLAAVCAQAQLTVNSAGETIVTNMKFVGATGHNSSETGTLCITSANATDDTITAPIFIKTKTDDEIYPFVHYKYGVPIFYINEAGNVYSSMYVNFSDSTSKTNILPIESPLEKLKQLQGVSFNYKADLEDADKLPAMGNTPEIREQIAKERTRKRLGLIAQEVEKVFPEAVRTQFDGKKGVMYTDLVGVLIAAINEMEGKYTTQISELQNQVNAMQAILFAQNGSLPRIKQSGNQSDMGYSQAILHQNTPNPFKQETTIAYRLPSDIQNAAICIYNLNGQQLKKHDLDTSVISDHITVDCSTFEAGMYIYALIIDGEMIASKRMILTD